MEEASRRSDNPIGFLRRGSGVSTRNQRNEERPTQYSNKAGKTTNLNPLKARWAGNKEKPRYSHEPFHSPSYKASSASSSKVPVRKNYEEKQKRPFLAEVDNAESSNRRNEIRRLQSGKKPVVYEDEHSYTQHSGPEGSSSATTIKGCVPEEPDFDVLETLVSSGTSALTADSTVNTALSTKPRRQKDKEESSSGRYQGACTFVRQPTVPQISTIGVKSSNSPGTGVQRRGLKNLGCTSISDVLPSGCSSSDSIYNRRVEVRKKRTSDAESSSRSRAISRQASVVGEPPAIYPGITGPRARVAEQSTTQQTARTCSRSIQEPGDSARTRRPPTQRARERVPGEREDGVFALRETVTRVHHPERGHFSADDIPPQRLARPFYTELPHAIYSSNHQGLGSWTTRRRSSSRPEGISPQMSHGLFGEGDGYRHINMEGIAEVLLTLDRIEQDDELTYEQLLVLETNLFLSGLGLHDQHHDMRLDIDNMSYEELLALEEQIGSVSTALSDEQFAKFVNRNVYKAINSERELNKVAVDDVKCSICQEEFVDGEEIGRMQCDHQYHVRCIHEWLRQKNWCPICKTSAIPSEVDKEAA